MATRESNLERNRWTIDLLDIQPADHVLELGPGPGVTLSLILERVSEGAVVAIDHSALMLALCRKRNAEAVKQGRLELVESGFGEIDEPHWKFDHIVAVNSLQFDAMDDVHLRRFRSWLKPGGTIAITFQPRGTDPSDEKAKAFGERTRQLLEDARFEDCRVETLPMEPVCAVCVLGHATRG